MNTGDVEREPNVSGSRMVMALWTLARLRVAGLISQHSIG
jgi:hypothetical protein